VTDFRTPKRWTPEPPRTYTEAEREAFCRGRLDLFRWWRPSLAMPWLRRNRLRLEAMAGRRRRGFND
jgi:hypothetical protein